MRQTHGLLRSFSLALMLLARGASAEDIDIFAGADNPSASLPSVMFVLDNTPAWLEAFEDPSGEPASGEARGLAQLRAIRAVLQSQVGKLNVGVMAYTPGGAAQPSGGYVRHALQELTHSSLVALNAKLLAIEAEIASPLETRASPAPYGNLMFDVYNYLAGEAQSFSGSGTPIEVGAESGADSSAYVAAGPSTWRRFVSPLSNAYLCANTSLIFIGNSTRNGPLVDDASNTLALRTLYQVASAPLMDRLAGDTKGEALAWFDPSFAEPSAARGWDVHSGSEFNMDDWSKLLHNYGIPYRGVDPNGSDFETRIAIDTYTIDIASTEQAGSNTASALWSNAAGVGGGRYFQVSEETGIEDAINRVLDQVAPSHSLSNTSFASVSVPASSPDHPYQSNQLFFGLFRPAPGGGPRWFGNLKRYQLALLDDKPVLADAKLRPVLELVASRASVPESSGGEGAVQDCAESFWGVDVGAYWENLGVSPAPKSGCTERSVTERAGWSVWSDVPDGPFVEKGGAAGIARKALTSSGRTLLTYTASGTSSEATLRALSASDATSAGLGSIAVLDYLRGDVAGASEVPPFSGLRASIHGDVVHSSPLVIRYDANTTVVYYGVNDGIYRALNAATGSELWGLVTPEHYTAISRLYRNAPALSYRAISRQGAANSSEATDAKPKDYFFDGATGALVEYAAEGSLKHAYIYPTQRRGGRMLYGVNVSNPSEPALMWRQGCPNLLDDSGCTDGFSNLGQTWSKPVGGRLAGYSLGGSASSAQLAVMFGGGFDECLDADVADYPLACSSAKGRSLYIVDAITGAKIRTFATDAPVVADVAVLDIDSDTYIDVAYAADTAGALYRINFSARTAPAAASPEVLVGLPPAEWTLVKIGHTQSSKRRFYNTPAVAALEGKVYVAIGSGDPEHPLSSNYPYSEQIQNRFYTLVDNPYESPLLPVDLDGPKMVDIQDRSAGAPVLGESSGWYLNLPMRGEQVVNSAAIGAGKVFFNTYRSGALSSGICGAPQGAATSYALNLWKPGGGEGGESGAAEVNGVETANTFPSAPVITTVQLPPVCEGQTCAVQTANPCQEAEGSCETRTVLIEGFRVEEVAPSVPPIRRRAYWIEDMDRDQ